MYFHNVVIKLTGKEPGKAKLYLLYCFWMELEFCYIVIVGMYNTDFLHVLCHLLGRDLLGESGIQSGPVDHDAEHPEANGSLRLQVKLLNLPFP